VRIKLVNSDDRFCKTGGKEIPGLIFRVV